MKKKKTPEERLYRYIESYRHSYQPNGIKVGERGVMCLSYLKKLCKVALAEKEVQDGKAQS